MDFLTSAGKASDPESLGDVGLFGRLCERARVGEVDIFRPSTGEPAGLAANANGRRTTSGEGRGDPAGDEFVLLVGESKSPTRVSRGYARGMFGVVGRLELASSPLRKLGLCGAEWGEGSFKASTGFFDEGTPAD